MPCLTLRFVSRLEERADFKGGTGIAVYASTISSKEGFKEKDIKGRGKGTSVTSKGAV
jgi:hypothetical protein